MYHPAGAASAYGEPAEGPAEGKVSTCQVGLQEAWALPQEAWLRAEAALDASHFAWGCSAVLRSMLPCSRWQVM